MPPTIQRLAEFLPFQMFCYVPIEIILNRMPPDVMLRNYAVGVVWLVISIFLFIWIWREGVKRFSAVGA
jgi:viologen exporter family transport system permease protein